MVETGGDRPLCVAGDGQPEEPVGRRKESHCCAEAEVGERKDRIEDALCATKAAIEEGIVPGGGSMYIRAFARNLSFPLSENPDVNTGINIVKNALMYPLKQLCSNAGIPGDVVVEKLVHSQRQNRINYGYNAKTNS